MWQLSFPSLPWFPSAGPLQAPAGPSLPSVPESLVLILLLSSQPLLLAVGPVPGWNLLTFRSPCHTAAPALQVLLGTPELPPPHTYTLADPRVRVGALTRVPGSPVPPAASCAQMLALPKALSGSVCTGGLWGPQQGPLSPGDTSKTLSRSLKLQGLSFLPHRRHHDQA